MPLQNIQELKLKTLARRTNGLRSLLKAVREAGGTVSGFTPKNLKQWDALHFVEVLGQNNIEFVYKGENNGS